jgi:hypothetical protein
MAAFCLVVPYSLVKVYWHFRGTRCLHHQDPHGDRKQPWNVIKLLPDYAVQQPRWQQSSYCHKCYQPQLSAACSIHNQSHFFQVLYPDTFYFGFLQVQAMKHFPVKPHSETITNLNTPLSNTDYPWSIRSINIYMKSQSGYVTQRGQHHHADVINEQTCNKTFKKRICLLLQNFHP